MFQGLVSAGVLVHEADEVPGSDHHHIFVAGDFGGYGDGEVGFSEDSM